MLDLNSWWLDASKCRKLGMLQNQKQYMYFEKKKKRKSPKNSETRRAVAVLEDHLLSFAVFWIWLCEHGQCRYSWLESGFCGHQQQQA